MSEVHPNYNTTKSKEERYAEDNFINPVPRAVVRSNTPVLLDGTWRFSIDTDDVGLTEDWYKGHEYSNVAEWPGSIEQHITAAKGRKEDGAWRDRVVAWYEREFPLPERVNGSNPTNSLLQLTFGACGYETRIWLNG